MTADSSLDWQSKEESSFSCDMLVMRALAATTVPLPEMGCIPWKLPGSSLAVDPIMSGLMPPIAYVEGDIM
jgi:hypothetical protein